MSEGLRLERLRATVARLGASASGSTGIAIVDVTRETHVSAHGDTVFPLGDLKRLAIALVVYRRADQRLVDLDAIVPLAPRDAARGNVERTYAQTLAAMLVRNDRYATADLLDALGGPAAVQAALDRLGLRDFDVLHGRVTPNAAASLLSSIAQNRYSKLDSTNELLLLLASATSAPGRLRSGLPPSTPFAHVSGTASDAGIVTLADGRRIAIAAFVDPPPATSTASAPDEARFTQLAQAVVEAFAP
jgi:beta-lactamase class A